MTRIKDLTALTSLATDDEFIIEDTSANQTKKITWANVFAAADYTPSTLTTVGSSSWFAAAFTPTYSGITIGDATVEWYFWQFGSIVWFWGLIIWGSTSVGTGDFEFTLPVASATMANDKSLIGELVVIDVSSTPDDYYEGSLYWGTGSDALMKIRQVSGANVLSVPLTGTLPITLATGDYITVKGCYRV